MYGIYFIVLPACVCVCGYFFFFFVFGARSHPFCTCVRKEEDRQAACVGKSADRSDDRGVPASAYP